MPMMLKPPQGGAWLDVDQVLARLQFEFARVSVAPESVREYAESVAASYRKGGHGEQADRLDAIKDQGVFIAVVEEGVAQPLLLVVLPGFPIMTGFASTEHLEAVQPLLRRCSAALGYELR